MSAPVLPTTAKESTLVRLSRNMWQICTGAPRNEFQFCLAIISISLLILVGLLISPQLLVEKLIENNKATRSVVAEKTMQITDQVETENQRVLQQANLEPVYAEVAGSRSIVMDKELYLLQAIDDVRAEEDTDTAEKTAKLEKLLDKTPKDKIAVIAPILLDAQGYQEVYVGVTESLEKALTKGIKADDLRKHESDLLKPYLSKSILASNEKRLAVQAIIHQKLKPTMAVDEKLTEQARQKMIDNFEPVIRVYNKGDVIVRRGETPSAIQLDALQKQGILNENRWIHILGVALTTLFLVPSIWAYLYQFERKTFFRPRYVSLLATLLIMTIGGLVVWQNVMPSAVYLYPMTILSFLITIFMNPRVAISITMMVLILSALCLQFSLEILAILALSAMAGITVLVRRPIPKDRFDILNAGAGVGVVQAISYLMISLIYQHAPLDNPLVLFMNCLLCVGSGVLSGMITLGALPIFEKWFKLITPFTLLELSKLDTPILKRMQLEAPGTFHHSLIISTISEAAAEAIGANGLLARVGSLYHDIGKVKRPLFFIENQAYFGAENPHDKLSPRLSKMIVMAHPRDGMEMGKKLGLPDQIIAFMPEHHGTLLAGYFYNKAILEEGEENVDIAQYRYPGPKPQCKETAIVMMADACESAVRSLKSPTQAQLEARIDKMIKQRIDDHQFSEAPITMKEIQIVRDTFVRVMKAMNHGRIEYQQAVIKDFNRHLPPGAAPIPALGDVPQSPPSVAL